MFIVLIAIIFNDYFGQVEYALAKNTCYMFLKWQVTNQQKIVMTLFKASIA